MSTSWNHRRGRRRSRCGGGDGIRGVHIHLDDGAEVLRGSSRSSEDIGQLWAVDGTLASRAG